MKMAKAKRSKMKSIAILLVVIILLVIGYGVAAKAKSLWPFDQDHSAQNQEPDTDTSGESTIDTSPATDEDQQRADQKKQDLYDRQKNDTDTPSSPDNKKQKNVDVTLTTFYKKGNELLANGFVAGVIENGGTCTLTVTNESGKSVSASRKGHKNATNTTCGQSSIALSKLTPGTWTPQLSYSSDTVKGNTRSNAAPGIEVK